jgi:hypothetical protein
MTAVASVSNAVTTKTAQPQASATSATGGAVYLLGVDGQGVGDDPDTLILVSTESKDSRGPICYGDTVSIRSPASKDRSVSTPRPPSLTSLPLQVPWNSRLHEAWLLASLRRPRREMAALEGNSKRLRREGDEGTVRAHWRSDYAAERRLGYDPQPPRGSRWKSWKACPQRPHWNRRRGLADRLDCESTIPAMGEPAALSEVLVPSSMCCC